MYDFIMFVYVYKLFKDGLYLYFVYSVLEKQGSVFLVRNISKVEVNYVIKNYSLELDIFFSKNSKYFFFGE